MFAQPFVQAQIKENIKAPRHWPLWGESICDRWIPIAKASNTENIPIWWRHLVKTRRTYVPANIHVHRFLNGNLHHASIQFWTSHYSDVTMSAMASRVTDISIVCYNVFFRCTSKGTSKVRAIGLCEGKSPVNGGFPSQGTSNAEDASAWKRHYVSGNFHLHSSQSYM